MSTCAQSQTGQDEDGSSSARNPAAAAAQAAAAAEVAAAAAAAATHGVDPTAGGNGAAGGHFLNAQVSAAAAVARNPLNNGPQRGMPVSIFQIVFEPIQIRFISKSVHHKIKMM